MDYQNGYYLYRNLMLQRRHNALANFVIAKSVNHYIRTVSGLSFFLGPYVLEQVVVKSSAI